MASRPAVLPAAPPTPPPGHLRGTGRTRPAASPTHPAQPRQPSVSAKLRRAALTHSLKFPQPENGYFRPPPANRKEPSHPFPAACVGPAPTGGDVGEGRRSSWRTPGTDGGGQSEGPGTPAPCRGSVGLAADSSSVPRLSALWFRFPPSPSADGRVRPVARLCLHSRARREAGTRA